MKRLNMCLSACLLSMLAITGTNADESNNAAPTSKPLPMVTEKPVVYETPVPGMVLLQFQLYDRKTWCFLYIRQSTWDQISASGASLPDGVDPGQIQCE